MKKLKRAYYYFYYAAYRLVELQSSPWWSETKAALILSILEVWLCLAVVIYLESTYYFDLLSKTSVVLGSIFICCINYYLFLYNNKWMQKIDMIALKKTIAKDTICWLVVIIIVLSLVGAFYKMSLVDWESIRNAPH
ncbi:hypothetical protein [uncultured Pedobacter sp.]|uniref:hypothetical protein n=1 Tax=uncultured Pedobacter sp. TaxID=246139 RepID=UPI00262BD514|nr:hypothetical protein [uncultured Pedobacter sp.]